MIKKIIYTTMILIVVPFFTSHACFKESSTTSGGKYSTGLDDDGYQKWDIEDGEIGDFIILTDNQFAADPEL
jgi:hypothetical protein